MYGIAPRGLGKSSTIDHDALSIENADETALVRVAVIFFGLVRSIHLSIKNIRRNIYDCNLDDKISLYTVASINMIETLNNPRSGEMGIPLRPADVFLLDADAYALIRQDDAAIALHLAAAQRHLDEFGDGWNSVRNALHQLAALFRASTICTHALPVQFDYFLFVRPDLIYLDEIRLEDIASRFHGEGNIALPPWHSFGGFNDRFALADAAAARHYAERLNLVTEYCAKRPFHSERLLNYALEKGGCKVCALPVRAERVRANGVIKREDFSDTVINLPLKPQHFTVAPGRIWFFKDATEIADARNGDSTMQTWPEGCLEPPNTAPPMLRRVSVDGFARVSPLSGVPYLDFLKALHVKRHVIRYLEIGTLYGASLSLAAGPSIAIDPSFLLDKEDWSARQHINLFEMTSDAFFSKHDPRDSLAGPVELAFIDGMHLSEFVFRDFINAERCCSKNSIIVLNNPIPQNYEMTERRRRTSMRHDKPLASAWTGDVWRVVPLLRRERPDLCVRVLDCQPTGLVLISNLNPHYRTSPGRLTELEHALSDSEATESMFWSFIESLCVTDSRRMLSDN